MRTRHPQSFIILKYKKGLYFVYQNDKNEGK